MKRNILFVLFAFGLIAFVSGQGRGRIGPNPPEGSSEKKVPAAETVTVSGSLVVAHGSPAVKSGDDIYLLRGINRLFGFVYGLKEGAQVTIEGKSFSGRRDNNPKVLMPSKLTLNGKTHDLSPLAGNFGHMGGRMGYPVPPSGPNRYYGPPPGYRNQMPPAPRGRQQPRQFNHRPNENWRQGRPRTL